MSGKYQKVNFLFSVSKLTQLPEDSGFEIAFAGRSNAGKSSAINTLTNQRSLARTSKTPGCTQLINFFEVDSERRIVDLPGYGYAKVSRSVQKGWQKTMEAYLSQRQCLAGLVLVMDIRHPLREFDLDMLNWCNTCELPAHILLTKSDKLKYGAAKASLHKVNNVLQETYPLTSLQLYSSLKKTGVEQLVTCLNGWFDLQ
ncbi:MAG: ribosome biogenesis GTP-binding protein YihA/YsxC [Thiohalomonadales bacterium]